MRVAILGCGYVGLELGRRLRADGRDVVGVRRSPAGLEAIEAAGLEAVRADATDPDSLAAVPDVDAVVFAASADGRSGGAARATYVDGLAATIEAFGARSIPPDRLVYTSSIGVYGDRGGARVDEGTALDPATDRGAALLEAERIARGRARSRGIDGTVVRLAGLYGPGRYRLERYLEGPVPEGHLNLLHRDDAAGVVSFLLATDRARDDVVLAVDDEPVPRPELARWLARQCGRELPETRSTTDRPDRRCSNARLRDLGYDLSYPTFREGYREAIAARAGGE